jgi:hypothetical protein
MPRFYFHIRKDGQLDRDPEGSEFDSLDMALKEAELAAREILADRLQSGEVVDGECFVIVLEDDTVVGELPFRSVLRLD